MVCPQPAPSLITTHDPNAPSSVAQDSWCHLLQYHDDPITCFICGLDFDTKHQLRDHQQTDCTRGEFPFPDELDTDQRRRLQDVSNLGSDEEKIKEIYRIVHPQASDEEIVGLYEKSPSVFANFFYPDVPVFWRERVNRGVGELLGFIGAHEKKEYIASLVRNADLAVLRAKLATDRATLDDATKSCLLAAMNLRWPEPMLVPELPSPRRQDGREQLDFLTDFEPSLLDNDYISTLGSEYGSRL